MLNKIQKGFRFLRNPQRYIRNIINTEMREMNYYPSHETYPQDIFVAGFPKSGNTWMQSLLASVIYGIDSTYLPDRLTQELVPEEGARHYYKRILDFVCFKTHGLPNPKYRRVIHLVRDPRDAMASYHAMMVSLKRECTLEEVIMQGKNVPVKWNEHARAWLNNPHKADTMLLQYEKLVTQPFEEMKRVCAFIGIERSDDLIMRAVAGNTFDKMKEKAKLGADYQHWNEDNFFQKFFRKGKIGSYKEDLPQHLIDFIEKEFAPEMKIFGYL